MGVAENEVRQRGRAAKAGTAKGSGDEKASAKRLKSLQRHSSTNTTNWFVTTVYWIAMLFLLSVALSYIVTGTFTWDQTRLLKEWYRRHTKVVLTSLSSSLHFSRTLRRHQQRRRARAFLRRRS
jgi:hypothetical protein